MDKEDDSDTFDLEKLKDYVTIEHVNAQSISGKKELEMLMKESV